MPITLMVLNDSKTASEIEGCVAIQFEDGHSPEQFEQPNDMDFDIVPTDEVVEIPLMRAVRKV